MDRIGAFFRAIGEKFALPQIWVPLATIAAVLTVSGGIFMTRGAPVWSDVQSWTFSIIIALVLVLVVVVILLVRHVFREENASRMDSAFSAPDPSAPARTEAAAAGAGHSDPSDQGQPGTLSESFSRGPATMQRDALGKSGYQALPWLLVLGERQSGKSELVRQSGLGLSADQSDRAPRPGPTEDLAWWLTKQAVVIDTAGAFLEDDSETGRERWRELLGHLKKERGARGLQGLVVTVAADRLLTASAAEIKEQGERIRRRFNELSVALCLDLPIYLVVTRTDRIEGFAEFTTHMSSGHAQEAFGWTNRERRFSQAGPLVREGLGELLERIEARLPATLTRPAERPERRRLMLFPDQLRIVSEAAAALCESTFAPSEFDEVQVPFLRGVYFTSATQTGPTAAPYLDQIGLGARRRDAGADMPHPRPLFIADLFTKVILPSALLAWRTSDLGPRSRRWVSAAAAALSLGLISYWGIAAWQQTTRIGEIREAVRALDVDGSISALDRLRKEIGDRRVLTDQEVEDGFAKPVLPGFGLGWALESARERAQTRFVAEFAPRREIEVETRLDEVARTDQEVGFGALATVVQERRFLESRQVSDAPSILGYMSETSLEVRNESAVESAYQAYGLWLDESGRTDLRARDDRFIHKYSLDYQRLSSMEDWSDSNTRQIRPASYAPIVEVPEGGRFPVTGIYTLRGYTNFIKPYFEAVEGILEERRRRGDDVQEEQDKYERLRKDYIESYYASWTRYLNDAPTGARFGQPLRDVLSSPHLMLLADIDRNTRVGLLGGPQLPVWIQALHALRREPAEPGRGYCAGLRSEIGEDEDLAPWEQYCLALRKWGRVVEKSHSAPMSTKGANALAISRELPAGPPEYAAAVEAAQLLGTVEDNRPCGSRARCEDTPAALVELLAMPIGDGVSDVLEGAVTALDERWRDVLGSYPSGAFEAHHLNSFYGPGGALASFLSGDVGSFYRNGSWRSPVDRPLPIGRGFRDWLQGAEGLRRDLFGQTYRPVIKTHGIDPLTEDDSRLSEGWGPTAALLRIRCATQDVEIDLLRNREWPLPDWSTQCRSVSMHIEVGQDRSSGTTVSPAWEKTGPFAVPELLSAIQNGGINMSFRNPRVTLRARIQIVEGRELRSFRQHPLVSSMRN